MPIWKAGKFVENLWQAVADDQPVPVEGPAIIGLKRWREERAALLGRDAPLALRIEPDDDWLDIVADLPRFPLVVVVIPKFADGRAFSIARLLRERDGYRGEIRATGIYIIDQVPFMMRVGIDAFETGDPLVVDAFEKGVWPEVPHYLQPAWPGDGEVPAGTRPWARQRALARE